MDYSSSYERVNLMLNHITTFMTTKNSVMKLTTEYLIIVEKESSQALYHLCDNVENFNKLLQTDPNIAIVNGAIRYKGNLDVRYEIKTGSVEGKSQRFYQVRFIFNNNEKYLNEYIELLRSIRSISYNMGG